MKNNIIANTSFGELLNKYDFPYSDLIYKMADFMLKSDEIDKEYNSKLYKEKIGKLENKIHKYASKSVSPSLPDLLIIMKIVGCGMEELLLTLKIEDHTKALLPSLNLDKYLLPPKDMKLQRQGYGFKILEECSNYQLNLNESYLRVTKYFKIRFYKQNLKKISDLIYKDVPDTPVNSYCMDDEWSVTSSSNVNYLNIEFNNYFPTKEIGEVVEIKVNLIYSPLDIEKAGFYTNHINYPTDLLKISGSFTGLKDDGLEQIRLRQYSNYHQDNKEVVEQKDIFLDQRLDMREFMEELQNPPLNSVFKLDWSGLNKVARQLI